MTINKQADLWAGKLGDEYNIRNQITPETVNSRNIIWSYMLQAIHNDTGGHQMPESFLEVGCGQGQNILAIKALYQQGDFLGKDVYNKTKLPIINGIEVNSHAATMAAAIDPAFKIYNESFDLYDLNTKFDCVFTSGLLIHIDPERVLGYLQKMYTLSSKYIICIEYFSPEPRQIEYQGEKQALWVRDYGSLWLDNFRLRCLSYGFMWKRLTGLDNLTYWVFQKAG